MERKCQKRSKSGSDGLERNRVKASAYTGRANVRTCDPLLNGALQNRTSGVRALVFDWSISEGVEDTCMSGGATKNGLHDQRPPISYQ
jgi:hypothetical protein